MVYFCKLLCFVGGFRILCILEYDIISVIRAVNNFYVYFKGTSRLSLFKNLDKLVDLDSGL